LQFALICSSRRDDGDFFHALVFAIAAIRVGIEVGNQGAFNNCPHRVFRAAGEIGHQDRAALDCLGL